MKNCTTLVVLAATSFATASYGAITSVSGQAILLGTPPSSCAPGQLTGFNAYAWDEQAGITPSAGLFCDMVNNPGVSTSAVPGLLLGTFDSHFIHYESVPGAINASGTVTFSGTILGVQITATGLDNTDATWGSFGTVYPTSYPFRGLNTTPVSTVTLNGNTLSFNFFSIAPTSDVVEVRVFTSHVPAPGAAALLGLAGLVAGRRRR